MKKKILGIITASLAFATCFSAFAGCGGDPPSVLGETQWQDLFDEVNFELWGKKFDGKFIVTKNSYILDGIEYGKNLDYEGKTYEYYKADDEVVACDASEYVDYATQFAPFFTFMHDNYSNFELTDLGDEQFFVYDDELPQDVYDCVLQMMKLACTNENVAESLEYDYHSIVLFANYDKFRGVYFMDGDYNLAPEDFYQENDSVVARFVEAGSCKEYQQVERIKRAQEEAAFYEKVEKAFAKINGVNEEEVNFVVKGGTGVDYMEFYFTDKGMRYLTPNANAPQFYGDNNIYVECIYYNDNGTYKYYKKTKDGVWSVTDISQEQYDTTIDTMYETYCGGKWFSTTPYIEANGNTWNIHQEYSASLSYLDIRYYNISIQVDADYNIVSSSWQMEYSGMGQTFTYGYTLTAGNATITVPTV